MTRKIPLLALGFGMALASAQAFAHGNHSHGPRYWRDPQWF